MIIGLTNKDANTNRSRELEKTAAEKYTGFFVDYDPKSKDKTIVVPDQRPFKEEIREEKLAEQKRQAEEAEAKELKEEKKAKAAAKKAKAKAATETK
jgi:hypothetical protein